MGNDEDYKERSPLNREITVSAISNLLRAKHSPSHESLYVSSPGARRFSYPPPPITNSQPENLTNNFSANCDQPLDFSKKRNERPSQRIFSAPILSPPSPAQPEPPSQILHMMEKYNQNVCQNPSSPSEQSGDDMSFHNGSEPEQSPIQRHPMADVPLPGMPCVSQLGAFGLPSLYRDFRPNSQEGLLNQNSLNTAGLLTTVQSLPISSTMPLLNSISPPSHGSRKPQKYARPFKAYPRDPLTAAVSMGLYPNFALPSTIPLSPEAMTTHNILSSVTDPAYLHFRQTMLENKRIDAKRKHMGLKTNGNNDNMSNSQHSNSDGEGNEACNNLNTFVPQPSQLLINCSRMSAAEEISNASSDDKMCNTVGTSTDTSADDNNRNPNNGHAVGVMAIQGISGLGQQLSNTPLNRKRNRSLPEELKDEAYWERRRKNNEAAKRSRDARRAKEDEIAIRAAYLERENLKLRVELAALRNETNKLRSMVPVQVFGN